MTLKNIRFTIGKNMIVNIGEVKIPPYITVIVLIIIILFVYFQYEM